MILSMKISTPCLRIPLEHQPFQQNFTGTNILRMTLSFADEKLRPPAAEKIAVCRSHKDNQYDILNSQEID